MSKKLKIPKNLKHADYVDLIQEIEERSLKTSEKVSDCKKSILNLKNKFDDILRKLEDLELRYCDLLLNGEKEK